MPASAEVGAAGLRCRGRNRGAQYFVDEALRWHNSVAAHRLLVRQTPDYFRFPLVPQTFRWWVAALRPDGRRPGRTMSSTLGLAYIRRSGPAHRWNSAKPGSAGTPFRPGHRPRTGRAHRRLDHPPRSRRRCVLPRTDLRPPCTRSCGDTSRAAQAVNVWRSHVGPRCTCREFVPAGSGFRQRGGHVRRVHAP